MPDFERHMGDFDRLRLRSQCLQDLSRLLQDRSAQASLVSEVLRSRSTSLQRLFQPTGSDDQLAG